MCKKHFLLNFGRAGGGRRGAGRAGGGGWSREDPPKNFLLNFGGREGRAQRPRKHFHLNWEGGRGEAAGGGGWQARGGRPRGPSQKKLRRNCLGGGGRPTKNPERQRPF